MAFGVGGGGEVGISFGDGVLGMLISAALGRPDGEPPVVYALNMIHRAEAESVKLKVLSSEVESQVPKNLRHSWLSVDKAIFRFMMPISGFS